MEVVIALEGIMLILFGFLFEKAFDKTRETKNRTIYLIIFVIVELILIFGLLWLGIKLFSKDKLYGVISLFFSLFFLVTLIYSFVESRKK